MLEIGSLVDRKYRILSEIGHGGMSVVYLAINERANKTWAIKEVRKDGVNDFEAVRQGLIVETDMLKKLNHPHLPSIIDVIDTEDCLLIVMDYIEGQSLQKVMEMNEAQSVELVVKWGKQMCDVLGYLHRQEPAIIYRDMKPSNIMLKPDGNLTLIDFGTAREYKQGQADDTRPLGTRGYAAPEQYGIHQTDARTDIFGLGATMYYLLTGHNPAEPPYEIKPLRYWDMKFAGTGMETIIAKCCASKPEDRYQSAAELYYALDHYQDLDVQVMRRRTAIWYSFVFSLAVMFVGIAGMVGFGIARDNAEGASYESYVEEGEKSVGFEEKLSYYSKAISILPNEGDAYRLLFNDTSENFDSNIQYFLGVLQTQEPGRDSNVTYLREDDPATYDWLQYNLGFGYVFLTSEPDWAKGAAYFSKVLESKYLEDAERTIAQICYNIGANINQLGGSVGKNNSGLSGGDQYTYSDFWNSLKEMITEENLEVLDRADYELVICKLAAYYINDFCIQFKSYGVPEAELREMLSLVEDWSDVIQSENKNLPNIQELYNRAAASITVAFRTVESVYQKAEVG